MAAARLGSAPLSRGFSAIEPSKGEVGKRAFVEPSGIGLLRVSLAIVYLWFGALKVAGISPAQDLVAETLHWFSPAVAVPVLGLWEAGIGLALLFGRAARIGPWLLLLHLPGTALPLLIRPDLCFTHWPLGLTIEGQYIVKNLVLASAALVVARSVRRS